MFKLCLRVIFPYCKEFYGMVQILPHIQVDLGTECPSSQPHAHIFTIADLGSLSKGLGRICGMSSILPYGTGTCHHAYIINYICILFIFYFCYLLSIPF